MIVGVPKETAADERRVALVPKLVPSLIKAGLEVQIEAGAGLQAGFPDLSYSQKGAQLKPQVLSAADIILKVRPPTRAEIAQFKRGATLIGFLEPSTHATEIQLLASGGVAALAMEAIPRIARAQSMDALSAMSTVAGYKAVLLAANHLHKFFPLLMTAAGTMPAAHVFVVGAGVAGLEAIGMARRLGAIVEAYDTRPAVREEVESVGGRFIDLDLETTDAEELGGYAKAQADGFYKRQQALMMQHVAAADVVITAALVRGRSAPVLITEDMVRAMRPGSVIVDVAADQGGNCALTECGKDVVRHGITILGPANLAGSMPFHASELYAHTVVNFLTHLLKDGVVRLDTADELVSATLITGRP